MFKSNELIKSDFNIDRDNPANIRLDEDVLKTFLVFVFRRRLQDVFKTSWSRRMYSPYSYVFRRSLDQDQHILLGHTSSRRFQDVFKTSLRHLQDFFKMFWKRLQDVSKRSPRRFQDVFKTSLRHLQDFFKMFWKRLQDVSKRSPRRLQGVFKTFWKHLQDIFNTFSRLIIKLKCSW